MNKAVLANFLRHLLFLFVVLDLVGGIFLIHQSRACLGEFVSKQLIPIFHDKAIEYTMGVAFDLIFTTAEGIGVITVTLAAVGFMGAIYYHKREMVNFVAGMTFLFNVPIYIICAMVSFTITDSLSTVIYEPLRSIYHSFEGVRPEIQENVSLYHTGKSFIYINGWSPLSAGTALNHSFVDYMQIMTGCCGLTGRFHWQTLIPLSCCREQNFVSQNCTSMLAYGTSCLAKIDDLKECLMGLGVRACFVTVLSGATAFVSLYLAILKMKYPDGDFGVDRDSSSEEEEG